MASSDEHEAASPVQAFQPQPARTQAWRIVMSSQEPGVPEQASASHSQPGTSMHAASSSRASQSSAVPPQPCTIAQPSARAHIVTFRSAQGVAVPAQAAAPAVPPAPPSLGAPALAGAPAAPPLSRAPPPPSVPPVAAAPPTGSPAPAMPVSAPAWPSVVPPSPPLSPDPPLARPPVELPPLAPPMLAPAEAVCPASPANAVLSPLSSSDPQLQTTEPHPKITDRVRASRCMPSEWGDFPKILIAGHRRPGARPR
jgi:hypothetical protein